VDTSITYPRQRVPMVNGGILEDRTRPVPDGTPATRRRDRRSSSWATEPAASDGRRRRQTQAPNERG